MAVEVVRESVSVKCVYRSKSGWLCMWRPENKNGQEREIAQHHRDTGHPYERTVSETVRVSRREDSE